MIPRAASDPAWGRDGVVEVDVPAPAGVEHSWFDSWRTQCGPRWTHLPRRARQSSQRCRRRCRQHLRGRATARDGTLDRAYGAAGPGVCPARFRRCAPSLGGAGRLAVARSRRRLRQRWLRRFEPGGGAGSMPGSARYRLRRRRRGGDAAILRPVHRHRCPGRWSCDRGPRRRDLAPAGDGSPDRSFGEQGTLAVFERFRSLLGFAARLSRAAAGGPGSVVRSGRRSGARARYGDGTFAAGLLRLDATGSSRLASARRANGCRSICRATRRPMRPSSR